MFTKTITVGLVAVSALAMATPVKRQTYTGQATYYEVGLGACGWTNTDDQPVIALNSAQFDGGAYCGTYISITDENSGVTNSGYVVDECPGCGYGSLDLSPSLFTEFEDESVGVFPISWYFE